MHLKFLTLNWETGKEKWEMHNYTKFEKLNMGIVARLVGMRDHIKNGIMEHI